MKVDIGQTVRCTGLARYIITDGDPLSARCEIGYTEYIDWHGTVLGHESCGNPT